MGYQTQLRCDRCGLRADEEDRRHWRSVDYEDRGTLLLCGDCWRAFDRFLNERQRKGRKGDGSKGGG